MRLVVVLLLALAGTASADKKTAERYFRAGERAYRAQSFEAAAQNFEEAYKELPLPEIAFSAAQAHRRQYRVDQKPADVARAVTLYRAYLAAVKTGGRVRDAADAISELQPEYDRLAAAGKLGAAAAAAMTRLGVGVAFADVRERDAMHEIDDHAGAQATAVVATIDDKQVEPNALVPVEPGTHVLRVRADGYRPIERNVLAIAGGSDLVDLELQPMPARVAVKTEAGARVSVDGRQVGTTFDLEPGKHLLAVARDGREPEGRELAVTRGQALALDVPLVATTRRKLVPWVAGAAGGLAVLAIVTTTASVHFDHAAAHDYKLLGTGDQPPAILDDYTSNRAWRDRTADAIWITSSAAVLVGATAAWLYYFDTPATEGVRVVPTPGGASIAGHF